MYRLIPPLSNYNGYVSSLLYDSNCIFIISNQSQGYFRGLSWPLLSYGVINSVFFGTYGWALKAQGSAETVDGKPQYGAIAVASAVANLPLQLIMCPVDVIKVTLQSQIPHSNKGLFFSC